MFPYLSNEEIKESLEEEKEREDAVILNFTQPEYLFQMRKKIASHYSCQNTSKFIFLERF